MAASDDGKKQSKVEVAKEKSRFLRGTIREVLASDDPSLAHDDSQLIKFHGAYQQYDRDMRKKNAQGKAERTYQFMVRVRIPAGRVTADQYLGLDAVTDRLADGSLRATSRQGIQFHGIVKSDLKKTLARVNETLLTTLGACGDVSRNVMMSPAPPANDSESRILVFARQVAVALRPATGAYHEIWLDGEKIDTPKPSKPDVQNQPANEEPFYGQHYLPRKFKIGFSLPGDNSVDLYTQDLGMLAVVRDNELAGVNLMVGGGLGFTHLKADTFARLASHLGFVAPKAVVDAARTVASIFRDYGNRGDRRHARLKYLIHERGMDWFAAEFVKRFEHELLPWEEGGPLVIKEHLGRHQAGDGSWYYGLYVENGRIRDGDPVRLRSALRTAVAELKPGLVFTPQQNVLLTGMSVSQLDRLDGILEHFGVPLSGTISAARKLSLACPAMPTCGLAIAESERVSPPLMDQIEALMDELGIGDEPLSVRMTGCPNGCVRPYTAEIGIVGRATDSYDIYVGGQLSGDTLADLVTEKVPLSGISESLRPLLTQWRDERQAGEGFGSYHQRVHHQGPKLVVLTGAKLPVDGKE